MGRDIPQDAIQRLASMDWTTDGRKKRQAEMADGIRAKVRHTLRFYEPHELEDAFVDLIRSMRAQNAAMRDALQLIVYFSGAPSDTSFGQHSKDEWLNAVGQIANKVLNLKSEET